MPFLKGKIGFTPMTVVGATMPDAMTIEARIVMRPYRSLGEQESYSLGFVNPGSTIEEEYLETYKNPVFRDFVVVDVLYQQRKVDMAKVRARTKFEFDRAIQVFKMAGATVALGTRPNKDEIRSRIIQEELPNAPIQKKTCQVLFAPNSNMIFLGTSSAKLIDTIIPFLRDAIFEHKIEDQDPNEDEFMILNALTQSFVQKGSYGKMAPFCFAEGQESVPQDAAEYMREFLTWFMLNSLSNSSDIPERIEVDDAVKLRYSSRSDLEQSQFKSRHDSLPIQTAGVEEIVDGGLVDEIALFVNDVDLFNMGGTGIKMKINKSGYISNLPCPSMKPNEREDMLPYVMEGVVSIYQRIAKFETAFFKMRKNLNAWTKEVIKLRAAVAQYATQYMDRHIELSAPKPDEVGV